MNPRARRIRGPGSRGRARHVPAALLLAALLGTACAGPAPRTPSPGPEPGAGPAPGEPGAEARPEPVPPDRYYWAYVASDGADIVSRLRFGPGGAVYEKGIPVGSMPDRRDGIGELEVSRDGSHWFLAVAGGATPGSVWKYRTGTDRMAGRVQLRGSPGSLALTPDGRSAYVTVGPAGGTGPAGVAVLRASAMAEATRLDTCGGARGSVMHPSGRWMYSLCVEDDLLVEISTEDAAVSRTVRLTDGGRCGPRDLALSPEGDRLYVACAEARALLVMDRDDLQLRRSVDPGGRPVAVGAVPDGGSVLVLLEDRRSLALLDADGDEVEARIPLAAPRPTSLAVSDDGRYAFVALRGPEGAPRSTVEVVDLRALTGVATIEVPEGASAAAFWRSVEGG